MFRFDICSTEINNVFDICLAWFSGSFHPIQWWCAIFSSHVRDSPCCGLLCLLNFNKFECKAWAFTYRIIFEPISWKCFWWYSNKAWAHALIISYDGMITVIYPLFRYFYRFYLAFFLYFNSANISSLKSLRVIRRVVCGKLLKIKHFCNVLFSNSKSKMDSLGNCFK